MYVHKLTFAKSNEDRIEKQTPMEWVEISSG